MKKEDMDYAVYCGIDIGKTQHHVIMLDPISEQRLLSRPIEQDERKIESVLAEACSFGKALVIVDQPGSIGRLVVAVAHKMGVDVAQLAPRKFKKAADTYGEVKTDAFDSYVITDTARSMPRMIELVKADTEEAAELKVLCSFRADIVKERTACYNRLHDCLTKVSPPLEALFSQDALHGDLALALLAHYGGPLGLKRAGKARVSRWASGLKRQKNRGPAKVEEVFEALSEMTLVLPATPVIEEMIKHLAARAIELKALAEELSGRIEVRAVFHPEVMLLFSMPGMSLVNAATIFSEIGDIDSFMDADHLASYAGVAPVKRESGTSVKGSKKPKGGNRRLKAALVKYAWAACLNDPVSKAYYDKKRSENKKHFKALLALSRRRIEVIYAMLKTGTYYQSLSKAA
jgi:transposase